MIYQLESDAFDEIASKVRIIKSTCRLLGTASGVNEVEMEDLCNLGFLLYGISKEVEEMLGKADHFINTIDGLEFAGNKFRPE